MGKHKKSHKRRTRKTKWHQPEYAMNTHHRLPSSRGGTNESTNLSRVPIHLHNIYNELFGSNPTAHEVAKILSDVWIDPKYEIIVRLRKEEDDIVLSPF